MYSRMLRTAALTLLSLLAACNTRSPDLPAPRLLSATLTCTPQSITVGLTSQCTLSQCLYEVFSADGTTSQVSSQCPAAVWSSSPGSVGSVNQNGTVTGIAPGAINVVASVDGGSGSATVQVVAACVLSMTVIPDGKTIIAGQSQQYTAVATFDNNQTGDVTSQTTWSSNNAAVTITPSGLAQSSATQASQVVATITGAYNGANRCASAPNPVTDTTTLTVAVATLLPVQGLCIEPVNGATVMFSGCRADTGACAALTPVSLTVSQTAQLRLRARYNNGLECNVTNDAGTAWTSTVPGIATVGTGATAGGLATGVSPGNANATASFSSQSAVPYPLVVTAGQVLGKNSLRVSAKPFNVTQTPRKFACVGSTDIVGALEDSGQIQGRLKLFAGARYCASNLVDAAGNCTTFTGTAVGDVTNDDGVTPLTPSANRIAWTQASSFWDGAQCKTTLPDTLPAITKGPTATVGDRYTLPADYAQGNRQPGYNGVVIATGAARVGFACITAQYTNPAKPGNTAFDGMTVLVLPVTNDVILGPSSANDATHLCDALEPLFQLAASSNGGDGALTQLLSAVTEIVNPIAQNIADGTEPGGPLPVTTLVDQVLKGISDPLTSQIFAAGLTGAVNTVDTGVYSPVICALGSLLNAITTQNPGAAADAQACLPTP